MFMEIDATEEGFEQGTGDVDSSALDAPRRHDTKLRPQSPPTVRKSTPCEAIVSWVPRRPQPLSFRPTAGYWQVTGLKMGIKPRPLHLVMHSTILLMQSSKVQDKHN